MAKLVLTGDGIDRHYYELCALAELKNALRSGDIWVQGSRQFKDFDEYLVPAGKFAALKLAGDLPLAGAASGNGKKYTLRNHRNAVPRDGVRLGYTLTPRQESGYIASD